MPQIGEVKKGSEIGYWGNNGYGKYIWHACIDCGKERWVAFVPRNKYRCLRCKPCSNKIRGKTFTKRYKGIPHLGSGRKYDKGGYILVLLKPDDFFYPMATKAGYVREHRLVVAKALGRCLQPWEIVHHKNGYAKDDNRYPKTLQLVTDDRHTQITILENKIARLEKENTELKLRQWT